MMNTASITATDFERMVRHWLGSEQEGYLGSSYGSCIKDLLQQPMHGGEVDAFLQKMREDIPALGIFPPNAINVYSETRYPDKLVILIELAGVTTVEVS